MSQQKNSDSPQTGARRVIEAEIINPESHNNSWQDSSYRARFGDQNSFSGIWTMAPVERNGCLAPAISFALFFICLGQFGVLAAIGFLVFYAIGGIIGSVHSTRRLMAGLPYNPWAWRAGNWTISFLLTVWLAGGFQN